MEYSKMTVRDFIRELESSSATPGGGAAAALCGAMAGSLCTMAASVTLGRETYKEAWVEMEGIAEEARTRTAILLELMERDAEAYSSFIEAAGMPKTPETAREARKARMQEALKAACRTPLETIRAVKEIARLMETLLLKGNPNAMADLGTAGKLLSAAAQAAAYNIKANLKGIEDLSFNEEILRALGFERPLVEASAIVAEAEMMRRLGRN